MKPIDVLMVDDNRGDVVLVEAAIEKAALPYRVSIASDGVEAVEFLHRRGQYAAAPRPELIMLDLRLPRKNGCEVLEEIRLDPLLGRIPLVLLSSSKSELKRARAYELAEECYLEKPDTYQGFVKLMQAIEAYRRKATPEERP